MSDQEQADAADEAEGTETDAEGLESRADTDADGLEDGDFVRVAYTIRTADDGRVIDTTDEETAEDAEIDVDEYDFEPRIIALGAGHVFSSVEEAFLGASVGDEGTVDVPAEDAFGAYDPDEVETVKADKIPEEDRYPGAQIQIDNRQGHLETIIGGRARVDFNHPLAGEDLEYEYEILARIDDREEQAAGMLGMYLQEAPEVRIETVTEEEETVTEDDDGEETVETEAVEKDVLYVTATQAMQMNQQWMFQKQQIAQDLMDRLDLDRVVIEEVIEGGGMGGLGGMMGGMGGGAGDVDIEEALEDVDVDADEIVDEIDEE
ncbi:MULTISPECIES: FKBP-type peptidyl-prolyl cis-trans isomerase [Halorubrum]|uniref:Peptidyl-prolyl cis-trans isomerase n=1 Tax=Halorubrum sodomense TaxID=35743 RepID=A0A1I6GQB1_HALSD|nr:MULTISPECIES: peptidylprolyl isomerase [Halorubrum]TKX70253.1 peptidylprolyl isomerase [Halorubrum sp. SP9]SFR44413.1 FKBP-type peptidyl-prolyl cis-trans isomerase SlyD [Halorubrum sodomense]